MNKRYSHGQEELINLSEGRMIPNSSIRLPDEVDKDGQSTSRYFQSPAVPSVHMIPTTREPIQQAELASVRSKQKIRKEARQEFVEGISITGLLEYYYAPSGPIRLMWALALLVSFGSIFYHSTLLIILYLNREPSYEIIQTDQEIIPFPKITVCSPSGINSSWVREIFRIPQQERRMYDQLDEKGKEEMIEEFSGLIGNSFRFIVEKPFTSKSQRYPVYNHMMAETFKYYPGGVTGMLRGGAVAKCERIVDNCSLGGEKFDCCQNSVLDIDDDGPCYDLGVDKLDLTNIRTSMASPLSFTFDLRMEWNYMLPYNLFNGYLLYIGQPHSLFGQPIAVPGGTHAMIALSQPTKRTDLSNCTNSDMPDTTFGKYDGKGDLCKMERWMNEPMETLIGCKFAIHAFTPNQSEACTGAHTIPIKVSLVAGLEAVHGVERIYQNLWFDITHSNTRCLPYCTRWEYTTVPSFSDLVRPDFQFQNGSEEIDKENVTLTRVTVYMTSPYYLSRTEQKEESFYKTFMLIDDVFGLYIGGSIVAMIEIVVYAIELCCVYMKTRNRTNRVGPTA